MVIGRIVELLLFFNFKARKAFKYRKKCEKL